MKHRYKFAGSVILNDHLAINMWKKEVIASNGKEANLLLREMFKKEYDIKGNHRVRLYGKFRKLEGVL